MKKILIIGNPNCGKTTLFNVLTGMKKSTGNRAGVTVDATSAVINGGKEEMMLIDLPGTYSLTPYTSEEKTVKKYLEQSEYDAILNVTDSTNPVRNLKLTTELAKYGKPVVVAFNLADRINYNIDVSAIENALGGTVTAVSASRGKGLSELVSAVADAHAVLIDRPIYNDSKKTYDMLTELSNKYIGTEKKKRAISERLLALTTGKYTSFPILLAVMTAVFLFSFGGLVKLLSEALDAFISGSLYTWLHSLIISLGGNEMLTGLFCDGILLGAGSVLSYVPQIAVLTFFMSLIEDSGYLSRAAFITDRLFGSLGINGKCFICLTLGFGCSVPAMMSARVLESRRDRVLCILLIPFLPCSAKLPLFVMLSDMFFGGSAVIIMSLYLLGAVFGILYIKLLSGKLKGSSGFFLELPPYRIPTAKSVFTSVYNRVRDFLIKAGTVIAICSVVIWFIKSFTPAFRYTVNPDESITASIGKCILPFLKPIGVSDGGQAVALFSGLFAREAIVSSLEILYNSGSTALSDVFSRASAYSYCVFSLLFIPCCASVITAIRELKSAKIVILMLSVHFFTAYFVSAASYFILRMIL